MATSKAIGDAVAALSVTEATGACDGAVAAADANESCFEIQGPCDVHFKPKGATAVVTSSDDRVYPGCELRRVDGAPVDERAGAMVRLAKEAYMTPRASA